MGIHDQSIVPVSLVRSDHSTHVSVSGQSDVRHIQITNGTRTDDSTKQPDASRSSIRVGKTADGMAITFEHTHELVTGVPSDRSIRTANAQINVTD